MPWRALLIFLGGVALMIACAPSTRSLVASGDQYAAKGLYREATIEYRKALERDPQLGEAHLGLARVADRAGDAAVALREYVRAADLLPGHNEAQLKACRYLLLASQFDEAGRRAEEILARDSNNVDALVMLGLARAGLRDLDGALADALEAIRLDPDRARPTGAPPALQQPRGQPEEGEKPIRAALKRDPSSVAARLAQVNLCWSTGRQAEVEPLLVDTLALQPTNETANRALAVFYVSAGRVADAEPYFKAVAASSPDARAQFALADYYSLAARYDEALGVLEPLTVRSDTSPAAWTRVAAIQHAQGKTPDANRTIDAAIARDKNNLGALLVKGRFLLMAKKPDEALVWLKAAAAIDPRSATAQYLLGTAYQARRSRDEAITAYGEVVRLNPRFTMARLQLAQLQLERGAADAAIESAKRAIEDEPGSLPARLLLANGYMARRDFTSAAVELKALAEQFPDAADVQVELGMLLQLQQDARGARAAYSRALTSDPNSFNALAGLVALDLAAKNVGGARARIDVRLAQAPGDAQVLVLAAQVAVASGDAGRAEQLLTDAIQADATRLEAYAMLGRLYLSQKRLDEARARFEELLKRQPRSVVALTMVGMVLAAQNQLAEAQRRFEQALEVDPRAPVAAVSLAALLADGGGNLDVALQLAQTAKEQLPESPLVDDTLGWIYVKKGLASLAIPPLLACAAADAANPIFQFHLGTAYLKAGDKTKARAAFERALTIDPSFSEAGETRKALASLQG